MRLRRNVGRAVIPAAIAVFAVGASAAPTAYGYTAGQAATGRTTYQANCVSCHGAALQGGVGPALIGGTLGARFDTAASLQVYIAAAMPMTAPGSLSQTDYWNLTAFLLQQNGIAPDGTAIGPGNAAGISLAPAPADEAPAEDAPAEG